MIESQLSNAMLIRGAVPVPAARPTATPSRASSAFGAALAGAQAVRDSRAATTGRETASTSSSQQASSAAATRTSNATRSTAQDDAGTKVSASTKQSEGSKVADAETSTVAAQPEGGDDAATVVSADAAVVAAAAPATVVVAAAPVVAAAAPADVAASVELSTGALDAAHRMSLVTDAADGTMRADAARVTTDAAASDAPVLTADGASTATELGAPTADVASSRAGSTVLQSGAAPSETAAAVAAGDDAAADAMITTARTSEGVESADAPTGPTRPTASREAHSTAGPTHAHVDQDPDAATDAPAGGMHATSRAVRPEQRAAMPAAANTAAVSTAAGDAASLHAGDPRLVTQAQAPATAAAAADDALQLDVDVDVAAPVLASTATTASAAPGGGSTAAGGEQAQPDSADAQLQPTTRGPLQAQQPANPIAAQLETVVQAAQARSAAKADAAAEAQASSSSSAGKPLSLDANLVHNLQANARVDQPAQIMGARVRELMGDPKLQERIDTIAQQLATRMRLSHAAGGSQIQLNLKPRELGDVTVQMKVREGVVAATVLVERSDAMRTIETNIAELKRSLEQQGLVIDQLTVDVRADAHAGGAGAGAFADHGPGQRAAAAGSDLAGAAGVIPGLTGDDEVEPADIHDGDVSVLV